MAVGNVGNVGKSEKSGGYSDNNNDDDPQDSNRNSLSEQEASKEIGHQVHDLNDLNDLTLTPIPEIIQKCMIDEQGNSKCYLTKEDFVYASVTELNYDCSEDQAEQTFYALIEERKLIEIEPGKYQPTPL